MSLDSEAGGQTCACLLREVCRVDHHRSKLCKECLTKSDMRASFKYGALVYFVRR